MADRLSIHFQPSTRKKVTPLSAQVQQITSQRGAFRNVNESSLQDEIEKSTLDPVDENIVDAHHASSDDEEPQARREKLWKDRDEILQKLSYAQNEILSALDFVSLLLSNHTLIAQSTMSPALKELVPPKSLDGKVVEYRTPTEAHREQFLAVSDGWKTENFRQASTKLKEASVRLERQTERQSQYWQQIAHLQERGWSISRLPSDSRAIGVHFGLQESAPHFRAKGFALLPQDDDGKVYLESRSISTQRSVLVVEVIRKGVQTGSYSFPTAKHTLLSSAESELVAARDALFNEELFYEISREARLIANQNVRAQPQAVEADIDPDCQIRILQREAASANDDSRPDEDDKLAQLISYCLCFLLIAEHRRLHARRTQPPRPMSIGPIAGSEYAILRPVLTQLRHEQRKAVVAHICRSFSPSFKSAGLSLTVEFAALTADASSSEVEKFEPLRMRLTSSVSIKIQGETKITLNLTTYLGSPSYGTTYEATATKFDFISLEKEHMDNSSELRTSLTSLLELVLVAHISSLVDSGEGNAASKPSWVLVKPHSGEFLVSEGDKNIAKVVVSIQSGCIALHSVQASSASEKTVNKKAYLWRAGGLQTMPREAVNSTDSGTFDSVITKLWDSLGD